MQDVGNLVEDVTVTSTVTHDDATVTVNETPVASGRGHTVGLDVGSNEIRVVVTAQDRTTQTYTVRVTRAESSDATLSGLAVSEGVLSPSVRPQRGRLHRHGGQLGRPR